ncbi:MAG: hypothetical protein EPN69_14625 [Rhodanobacter sp.]|nr:MAG: hypothetical protein EPN71_14920 [Rhodanobacter sp.]TAL89322.1 MAG: hypothetical protein EPN69_14625 [Rhodanobacter sp.]TAM39389.1 MAG: hypothetical protein EPN58_13710 [Rhodanobacter sp.]TAN26982.1 MAG: hypothetical protein EPN32_05505 [Rhodanobacter sp.]
MKSSPWRLALPWLLLLMVGLGATALRFGLIESSAIGPFCSSHDPWWCSVRTALVLGFLHNVYGVAALLGAVLALVSRRLALAWLAAALGFFAIQLYGVETGALAVLIGSLRLLRLQAEACAAPVEPYRQGQQRVQSQP